MFRGIAQRLGRVARPRNSDGADTPEAQVPKFRITSPGRRLLTTAGFTCALVALAAGVAWANFSTTITPNPKFNAPVPLPTSGWYQGDSAQATLQFDFTTGGYCTWSYAVDDQLVYEKYEYVGSAIQSRVCTITGEGAHEVIGSVLEAGTGLFRTTAPLLVRLDATPPTSTLEVAAGGWIANNTIGLISYDSTVTTTSVSGVKTKEWWNSVTDTTLTASPATGSANITLPNEGEFTVRYRAQDWAGNWEAPKSLTLRVDAAAPVTTFAKTKVGTNVVQVSLGITDGGAGAKRIWYRVGEEATQSASSFPATFTVDVTSDQLVTYYGEDLAGNLEAPRSVLLRNDTTGPVTARTGSASGAWTSGTASFSLNCTDGAGWGATSAWYSLDGLRRAYSLPATSVVVSGEGTHTLTYSSLDAAGNYETTQSATFHIDNSPPATGASGFTDGEWHPGDVSVTFSPTDALSGSAHTYYRVDSDPIAEWDGLSTVPVSGDGTHTLEWYSVDNVGNRETTLSATVKVDNGNPDTIASGFTPGVWVSAAPLVSLVGFDAVSGVDRVTVEVNGESFTYLAPFFITKEGTSTLSYATHDRAGRAETTQTATIKVDTVKPVTTPEVVTGTLRLSVEDTGSGSVGTTYTLNGGPATAYEGPIPVVLGDHFTFYSTDAVGNVEILNDYTVPYDDVPPVTGYSGFVSGAWRNTPALVTLSADDGSGWGPRETLVATGGAESQIYALPFQVDEAGVTVLQFRSRDWAGNWETTQTHTIGIDYEAPTTTATGVVDGERRTSTATVTLDPTEHGPAGLAGTWYRVGGGVVASGTEFAVTGEGTTTVEWGSFDHAGNSEATNTIEVWIDVTPPVSTAQLTGSANSAGWRTAPTTLTITAEELLSPPAVSYIEVDGGGFTEYTEPIGFSADCSLTVTYRSVDLPGNTETPKTIAVKVDTQAPVTGVTTYAESSWLETAPITFGTSDNLSGVADTYYRVSDEPTATYSGTFGMPEGQNTLTYWSVDAAGNVESPTTVTLWVDGTAPVTAMSGVEDGAWRTSSAHIELFPFETNSGLAETWYSIDGAISYGTAFDITKDGTTTIEWGSADVRGNREETRSATVLIDRDPPQSMATGFTQDGWDIWPMEVVIDSTDTTSGVSQTWYAVDGGPVQTGSVIFMDIEGTTTVTYGAVDRAGNREATRTAIIQLDSQAPSTEATGFVSGEWRNTDIHVTLSPSDQISGVQQTWYSVNEDTFDGTEFDVTDEGWNIIVWGSVDVAGNGEPMRLATVGIDRGAPVTTARGFNDSGWDTGPVNVELDSSDSTSGVSSVWHSIDDGEVTEGTSAYVAKEGTTVVSFGALDAAGNEEATKTAIVRIDSEAPTTTASGFADGQWRSSTAHVTLSASDAHSGAEHTWYSIDGVISEGTTFDVEKDGSTAIEWGSIDAAGNREATRSATILIDRDAPQTVASGFVDGAWRTGPALVTLASSDGTSGVGYTWYSINGGPSEIGTSFPVVDDWKTEFHYGSVDLAGNREPTRTASIRIDQGDPVTGASGFVSGEWRTDSAHVVLSPWDSISGVSATWYSINGSVAQGNEFDVSDDGTNTVEWGTIDVAGNREATRSATICIDREAPLTSPTGHNDGGWDRGPVTIDLAALDTTSGVASTWYCVNDGSVVTSTSVRIDAEGTTTITYGSVDFAGNREETKTTQVQIDTGLPSTSASGYVSGIWYTQHPRVEFAPTDSISGIRLVRYWIGDGEAQEGTSAVVAEQGDVVVSYQAEDVAGNRETTRTLTVRVDTEAPVTSADGYSDGSWRSVPATVTLNADDGPGAGVIATWYCLDGVMKSGTSFVVDGEGVHTLSYGSADSVGNVEPIVDTTVKIDFTAPRTSVSSIGTEGDDAVISLLAEDEHSGVAETHFRIGDGEEQLYSGPLHAPLGSTVTFYSLDAAGNREDAKTTFASPEANAPITTVGGFEDGVWRNLFAYITLDATDGEQGVGVASLWRSINGGLPREYTEPFRISGEGTNTIEFGAVDRAGVRETTRTMSVLIDYGAPTVQIQGAEPTFTAPATMTLSAEDALSGVGAFRWRLRSEYLNREGYSAEVTVSAGGSYTLEYAASDVAGNWCATQTVSFIMRAKPTVGVPRSSSYTRYYRRYFTIYGYLNPRHTAGAKSVKIYAYRYESGRWVKRATWYPKNYNSGTITKYSLSTRFMLRGRWRVRAYHGDAVHPGTYSSWRYFTVK